MIVCEAARARPPANNTPATAIPSTIARRLRVLLGFESSLRRTTRLLLRPTRPGGLPLVTVLEHSTGRSDSVCIEDRVDVPQPGDALLELLRIAHLEHEPVLDHRVLRGAACLKDVQARLSEGPGEIMKHARPAPGIDLQLAPVGGLVVPVPAHLGEALGRLLQRGDVAAVLPMDRDAAPQRHVADDVVARHRPAALCEP